ncbi:MAG TPA: PAS domain S-box protein [Candidatus Saccharimonadales bacterium]|nr:PAS domain S-box protein [Candidatus Saccharimonadales bacterium]
MKVSKAAATAVKRATSGSKPGFLTGGGEMGDRIRRFDWAKTSLGPLTEWPQSLRTAVNIVLQSPVPLVMLWGQDGIMLYNDAYSRFAGARHPSLLGSKVVEGWPEVADFNRNVMRQGLQGKTLSYKNQQLTLYRNNVPEEVWMDLNYSPIMDESGQPAGVLAIVVETTQRVLAEQKQQQAENILQAERNHLQALFMQAPAIIGVCKGPNHVFELANPLAMRLLGAERDLTGKPIREALPEIEGQGFFELMDNVYKTGKPFVGNEIPAKLDRRGTGQLEDVYLNFVYQPLRDYQADVTGIFIHAVEVTEQVKTRKMVEGQNQVLEMITSGTSLAEALEFLAHSAEEQSSHNMKASILLLDEDGKHLRHGAAPSLPKAYNKAIGGIAIGPAVGSCGTAAYTKEPVIVSDIATDPLWKDFKDLAHKHNLRSCWSMPIFSAEHKILGTFALYYDEPRTPSPEDQQIIDFASRTAALAIERKNAEEELKRFKFMSDNANDAFILMRQDGTFAYLNDLALERWGYTREEAKTIRVPDVDPIYDDKKFNEVFARAQAQKIPAFETLHRSKDGHTYPVEVSMGGITLEDKPYMLAVARDITERKQTEQALLQTQLQLKEALSIGLIGAWTLDIQTSRVTASESLAHLFGVDPKQAAAGLLTLDVFIRSMHPDDRDRVIKRITEAIQTGEQYDIDYRVFDADGKEHWVLARGQNEDSTSGAPQRFSGVLIDVTKRKEAEEAVKASEERFRTLIEQSTDAIQLVTPTGKILYTSESIKNVLGYSPEELQGLGVTPFMHPDDLPNFAEKLQQLINGPDKQVSLQYRVKHKDGSWAWVETTGVNHLDTPKINALVGTFRNITDRKTSEEALLYQNYLTNLISDNASVGLLMMDDRQHCTFMNPAAEHITGFTFDEVRKINKPLHDIVHHTKPDGTPYPMAQCPIDRALPQHNKEHGEDMFVHKDGSFYHVAFTASPIIRHNKPIGTVIEVLDITKSKQLERQKDDFIGIASHELKTPVTSIKAYTQILQRRLEKLQDTDAKRYITRVDAQVTKLTSLINDLLDVTKIESGKLVLHWSKFDFDGLVREVVEDLQLTTDKHSIMIEGTAGKIVTCDSDRIGQVLTNLISNAIKYSPHTDKIMVKVSADSANVTVCVQDFGVGISREKQQRVFERFFRVSGPGRETFPGLGLGLYISAEIVKRQGGRIWVESASKKGSTFCFTLPLRPVKPRRNPDAKVEMQHE